MNIRKKEGERKGREVGEESKLEEKKLMITNRIISAVEQAISYNAKSLNIELLFRNKVLHS